MHFDFGTNAMAVENGRLIEDELRVVLSPSKLENQYTFFKPQILHLQYIKNHDPCADLLAFASSVFL